MLASLLKYLNPHRPLYLFVRADLIEVYKIFNGLDSLDLGRYFVWDVGVTRGHSFKLFKKRVSLDVGRYKFGNSV